MDVPKDKNIIAGFFLLLLLVSTQASVCFAQQARLYLDLQLSQSLANSQVINLTHVFSTKGRGPVLFNLYLQNENAAEPARDLYFNLSFYSDKNGLLADLYQRQGQPFSLDAGQQVHATNHELKNGLPGVQERIEFEGGLTVAGEQLINSLRGSTKLPPDRYVIQLNIYQGSNSRNGGAWVASVEAELGSSVVEDVRDIYLTSPGDVLGSNVEIANPYPEFRWEGSPGTPYRLVVVEAKGQESAQSLLQGALSTQPSRGRGNGHNVTLLDYEILDVQLHKASYQFPPSGVKRLEPGKVYYWQVLTELATSNGRDIRASEIWSFTLAAENALQPLQANSELGRFIRQLIGNARFQELRRNGFRLQSLLIDGEVVAGPLAEQRLLELRARLERGEISIESE